MKKNLFFIFYLLLVANIASAQSVIGGTIVNEGAYPWMTTLVMSGGGGNFCGASLIAPQWVVSAAHCSGGGASIGIPTPSKVIINAYNQQSPKSYSETIDIEQIYLFPGFDIQGGKAERDIALIKLASPSQYAPINIVNLDQAQVYNANAPCKVLGWGSTNSQGAQSPVLLQANIKVIDFNTCNQNYGYLTDSVVCAGFLTGETPAGAGSGDSGGPLIAEVDGEWVLIGVVSGGGGTVTTVEQPGFYTKVYTYYNWINEHLTPTSTNKIEDLSPYIKMAATNDQLRLNSLTALPDPADLIISDAMGHVMLQQKYQINVQDEQTIDISSWPSGCYFLALRSQKTRFSGKFVKSE